MEQMVEKSEVKGRLMFCSTPLHDFFAKKTWFCAEEMGLISIYLLKR